MHLKLPFPPALIPDCIGRLQPTNWTALDRFLIYVHNIRIMLCGWVCLSPHSNWKGSAHFLPKRLTITWWNLMKMTIFMVIMELSLLEKPNPKTIIATAFLIKIIVQKIHWAALIQFLPRIKELHGNRITVKNSLKNQFLAHIISWWRKVDFQFTYYDTLISSLYCISIIFWMHFRWAQFLIAFMTIFAGSFTYN